VPRARGLSDATVTIVATEVIVAADGVPEHCRVNGLIARENRFEVNLPRPRSARMDPAPATSSGSS